MGYKSHRRVIMMFYFIPQIPDDVPCLDTCTCIYCSMWPLEKKFFFIIQNFVPISKGVSLEKGDNSTEEIRCIFDI